MPAAVSKFRLFAGPNASGKTYLFDKFRDEKIIHTEIYVKLLPKTFLYADSAFIIDNSNEAFIILKKESGITYSKTEFPAIINKSIQKILKDHPGKSLPL